jgi:hypothetical protein
MQVVRYPAPAPSCNRQQDRRFMDNANPAQAGHLPRWLRFVLALWVIVLLLFGLQALELSLFVAMGG